MARWSKTRWALAGGAGAVLATGLLFGTEAWSYIRSSAGAVQSAVKGAIPVEFELQRARDLLADVTPRVRDQIRQIAREEVQIEALSRDIARSQEQIDSQTRRLSSLRELHAGGELRVVLGGVSYSRSRLEDEMARDLRNIQEAQRVVEGKQRVLERRQQGLASAIEMLERIRQQKTLLEDQIAALESQAKMIQTAAVGSRLEFDDSILASVQRVIDDVQTRLDEGEKILAREAYFSASPNPTTAAAADVAHQVDAFLTARQQGQQSADAENASVTTAAAESERPGNAASH